MNDQPLKHASETEVLPRIYVASLADYNAGRLHGRWIDANQPAECIHQQINGMLAESKDYLAEEWAIHNDEGFGSLHLTECADLEQVAEIARLIVEHGELFAELVAYCGGASNVEEARRLMEVGYEGAFDTWADYAQEFVKDCYAEVWGDVPKFIREYIDYPGIGRALELDGNSFAIEYGGQLHIFNTCI